MAALKLMRSPEQVKRSLNLSPEMGPFKSVLASQLLPFHTKLNIPQGYYEGSFLMALMPNGHNKN